MNKLLFIKSRLGRAALFCWFVVVFFFSLAASHISGDTFRVSDALFAFFIFFPVFFVLLVAPSYVLFASKRKLSTMVEKTVLLSTSLAITTTFLIVIFTDVHPMFLLLSSLILSLAYMVLWVSFSTETASRFLWAISWISMMLTLSLMFHLRYTSGNVVLEDWVRCANQRAYEVVETENLAYRKTDNFVCVPRNFCRDFPQAFSCRDANRHFDGYVPLTGVQPNEFFAILNGFGKRMPQPHWMISVGENTFFYSTIHGNKHFFRVESEQIVSCGSDVYFDSGGYIWKNKRIQKLEDIPFQERPKHMPETCLQKQKIETISSDEHR